MFLLVFAAINDIIYVMREKKTRKLTCIVTGRALLATKEYYERKVQKAGDEETLHNTYVCKEAKDLLLKGYTVEKIRSMLSIDCTDLKDVSQEIISEVLNSRRTSYRKVNIFNASTNLLNFKTDPDVKKLIENLKNE
tara:strand:- start:145 stop:555 length:411 start_codon:yes stop_codon:yes gene_type:complete